MNTPAYTLRAFFKARYADPGSGSSYFCLGYIDGDPSIPKGTPGYSPMVIYGWYTPRQIETAVQTCIQLAERGLNIYVSHCLHSEKQRVYPTALPSRWLWVDDAPADLPCTELVQSSEGSYQAWFELEQSLSADERSDLQRAIKEATSGADDCSSDAVHMVRVPFGFNTKRHGQFAVHMARQDGQLFSADELRERYPLQGERRARRAGDSSDLGLAHWEVLPIGADLLTSPRWQTIIEKRSQLKAILIERQRVPIPRDGRLDDSDSTQVSVLVSNFLSANLPHIEIRAVMLHLRTAIRPGQTLSEYQVDVDRLFSKYQPANYKPEATRWLGLRSRSSQQQPAALPPATQVEQPRRGPGRPVGTQEARRQKLLRQLATIEPDDFGRRVYRRELLAGALGVSERTIAADLSALVDAEQITRGQIAGNGAGFVILTSDFRGAANYSKRVETASEIGGETNVLTCGIPMPAPADQIPVCNKEESVHTATLDPAEPQAVPAPATPQPAPAPRPARAQGRGCVLTKTPYEPPAVSLGTREELESLIIQVLERGSLNSKTGELRAARLPTVTRWIEEKAPGRFTRHAIRRVYNDLLKARRRERQQERVRLTLQHLEKRDLIARLEACDRVLAVGPKHKKYKFNVLQRVLCLEELERRERDQVLVPTHILNAYAVGPKPGKHSDTTLFDLVDGAERGPVTRWATRVPASEPSISSTPEKPAEPELQAREPERQSEGWKLIARLQARKAAASPPLGIAAAQ